MKNRYFLLFRTTDAELRALEKSNFPLKKILPIIELTKGKKSKTDSIGKISKRIDSIKKIFQNETICLDITTLEELSNVEITSLYDPLNGYENWCTFLIQLKNQNHFKEIIPTLILNTEDTNLYTNLLAQVESLSKHFNKIMYRNDINDDFYLDDINKIYHKIIEQKMELFFVIDCGFTPIGAIETIVQILKIRIQNVKELIPNILPIIISTSFPRYVTDIGNDKHDCFTLNEITLFSKINSLFKDCIYGDYGSINPKRNDNITMTRGWIPRIDVPTKDEIFYYREKNALKDYAQTYSKVALLAFNDSKFPRHLSSNWGIQQIILSKNGNAPGSSPSFWISVRMSIHIENQLQRIFNE